MSHTTNDSSANLLGSDTANNVVAAWWSIPGLAIAAIWLSTVVSALFAPDMVTGSQHEHLPLGVMTGWIWAVAATGYVLMAARGGRAHRTLVVGTTITWFLVALAVAFGPALVTGTDPTTIPLSVLLAPIAGAIATGFIALDSVGRWAQSDGWRVDADG